MQLTLLYVTFLAVATVSGQDSSAVIMNLSYEGNNNYIIGFKFPSKVFQSLYQCMCADNTSRCNISYSQDVMQAVQPERSTTSFLPPCKLYNCTNSGQFLRVTCAALKQTDTCARQVRTSYVSLNLGSSCAASCIGIVWNLNAENITFNDQQLGVRQCGDQCCSGQSSEKPQYEAINEREYHDTYIVAGIAAGVVLVAIIVFVVFLLLKHRSASSAGRRENANITQNSTNGTNHNLFSNVSVINTLTHTNNCDKDASKKLQPTNPFAGLGVDKAKHNLGHPHKTSGTDDTHNKPAQNKIKDKKSGKHLFKRKSNKPAGFNDAVPDDNGDSHNCEGDYAEIDDYQIQDSSLEYIPDSSEIDLNDGYSTVDNSDYYNIHHNTPGSADSESREGSADFFAPKKASLNENSHIGLNESGHQTSNVPVKNNNFSEYFVAGAMSGEAATYSMGQPVDGAERDFNTRLEEGQDNTSNNENSEKKRISYFILEKETEEDDI